MCVVAALTSQRVPQLAKLSSHQTSLRTNLKLKVVAHLDMNCRKMLA